MGHWGLPGGRQIDSEPLIMPDTCLDRRAVQRLRRLEG